MHREITDAIVLNRAATLRVDSYPVESVELSPTRKNVRKQLKKLG